MTNEELNAKVILLNEELHEERAKCKRAARELRLYEEDLEGALSEGIFQAKDLENAQLLIDNLTDQMRDVFKILRKEHII